MRQKKNKTLLKLFFTFMLIWESRWQRFLADLEPGSELSLTPHWPYKKANVIIAWMPQSGPLHGKFGFAFDHYKKWSFTKAG